MTARAILVVPEDMLIRERLRAETAELEVKRLQTRLNQHHGNYGLMIGEECPLCAALTKEGK